MNSQPVGNKTETLKKITEFRRVLGQINQDLSMRAVADGAEEVRQHGSQILGPGAPVWCTEEYHTHYRLQNVLIRTIGSVGYDQSLR
jgi:hypothetical protein